MVDPLAEKAYSWTPYRYGFDNPIAFTDPTGLFESRREAREYKREHDLHGRISRGKDGVFSINDNKNNVAYYKDNSGIPLATGNADGVTAAALVNKTNDGGWMESAGRTNFASELAFTALEKTPGSFRMSTSTNGFSPKYYRNSWGGNQYVKTLNIGKVGKGLGLAAGGVGLVSDGIGVFNYYENSKSVNAVHPGKAAANATISAYGIWVDPVSGTLIGGMEAFYPGGVAGYINDVGSMQQEFNEMTDYKFRLIPFGAK